MDTTIEILRQVEALVERSGNGISNENKPSFERSLTQVLEDFLGELSKPVRRLSNGGWDSVQHDFKRLRRAAESRGRLLDLENPASQDTFRASVFWAAEQGAQEHLEALRTALRKEPRLADETNLLAVDAVHRIEERIDDFGAVVEREEQAYRRNRDEWDRQYAGQFIAIVNGKVVASSESAQQLSITLQQMQRQQGRFRAYVVKVGEPVARIRAPARRLRQRKI